MDPLSALSVAASAVQFVDFASSLLSSTAKLCRSASSGKDAHANLKTVTEDLREVSDRLIYSSKTNNSSDKSIKALCVECHTLAQKLLEALNKLSVQPNANWWSCFQVALKTIWEKGEVDALQSRFRHIATSDFGCAWLFRSGLNHCPSHSDTAIEI